MERCLVTVRREGKSRWHDVELPMDMPAAELVPALLKALRWDQDPGVGHRGYTGLLLKVEPPGRTLGAQETLEDLNVKDGAVLTLVSGSAGASGPTASPAAARPRASAPKDSRVPDRWKVLDED